jgi:hypothetical protein
MALFEIAGIRFGWSSVIGIIPEIGDVIDMALALMVFRQCTKCGLRGSVKLQMLMWILVDFVIGLVPLIGDLLDASIKANTMNVRLLEKELDRKYKPKELMAEEDRVTRERRKRDPSYRPPAPATVYEELSDDEMPAHMKHSHDPTPDALDDHTTHGPTRPEAVRTMEETRGGNGVDRKKSRGWFSRQQEPDVEMQTSRPHRNNSRRT